MKKMYVLKNEFLAQRPRFKCITGIYEVNEKKNHYVDLDTLEVFKVLEKYDAIKYTQTGKAYDLVVAQIEHEGSITKQGDPAVHIDHKLVTIARIVATLTLPNPNFYPDILHLNWCRFDNRPENLKWVSKSQYLKAIWAKKKAEKEKEQRSKEELRKEAKKHKSEAEIFLESMSDDEKWQLFFDPNKDIPGTIYSK